MNALAKGFSKKILMLASFACICSLPVNAATVKGKTSYISDDYGTDYSYTGYKSELTLQPDDSNMFLTLESREYKHESSDVETRQGVGVGYNFKIAGGFIRTEFKLRTEQTKGASPLCQTKIDEPTKCSYVDGEKLIVGSSVKVKEADYQTLKTTYSYNLNRNFKLAGRFDLALIQEEFSGNKETGAVADSEHFYFFTELRPGIKVLPFNGFDYFKNSSFKFSSVDFIYYYANKQSTKGGVDFANGTGGSYGLDDSTSTQQLRIETNYRNGKWKVAPFARIPLGWGSANQWYESGNYPGIVEVQSKALRLGVKLGYQFSKSFAIVSEVFKEDIKFHATQNVGKDDISRTSVEIGLGYKF